MRQLSKVVRPRTMVLVVASVVGILLSRSSSIKAQNDQAQSYPLILTAERAWAFVRAAEQKLDYLPGEVLVKFKTGVTARGQDRALSALRSRPASTNLQWHGEVALYRDPVEADAEILSAQLASQPEVEYAEPNYLRRSNRTPNDPGFSRQWNFTALDLPRAWDINNGATNAITVAVVDTGITTVSQSFPFQTWNGRDIQTINVPFAPNLDLAASRLVGARDFVFWTGPVLDMVGHGTHVSSTIGEDANNALAETGIAFNVKIMPVKVCVGYWEIQFALSAGGIRGFAPLDAGGCNSADFADGVRYAVDNGAKVINVSLGGPEQSQTELDALKYAVGKGAFLAMSAGNSHDEGNPVEFPAGHAPTIDGAMSVGAVGRSLTRAYYSNTGSYVEIAAPGGNDRDGGTNGMIWQTTLFPLDFDEETVVFPRFDRYAEVPYEGTSMAAPHVAGTAALILSQGVTSPSAIEALIKKTARDLGTRGRDDEYGFGLIQPRSALFGFGVAR